MPAKYYKGKPIVPINGKEYSPEEQDVVEEIFMLRLSVKFLKMACRTAKPIHKGAINILNEKIRSLGGVPD